MASSTDVSPSSSGASETDIQIQEVNTLKDKYEKRCKVICNIGDFRHVISVVSDHLKLKLKFQLESSYPQSSPGIVVQDAGLDNSQIDELTSILKQMAVPLKGQPVLENLIKFAFDWCESKECCDVIMDEPKKRSPKKYKNQKRNKEDDEMKSKKLPSMKTAEDVISRIMWDENIPTEHFTVAYLDRFLGVVEKKFMEFSWEDIASVDYDTLAIPRHRIQYFKYKKLVIWDKNKRQDDVFGSTGSGNRIQDVIEKYETEPRIQSQDSDDSAESDSDDEDVVITTEKSEQFARDKYWGPKKRPTHFICLRVTSPEVIKSISEAHRQILDMDESYEDSLIPVKKLHMTLACLGLDDEDDIEKAADFLRDIHEELESFKPRDIEVDFNGVDNFFHNVLYAKVKPNENLMNFVEHLHSLIRKSGIEIRDVFDFEPHMTILKFKKHHQAIARTRYIDPKVYDMLADTDFGVQKFDNVHLCKMSTEEASQSFYDHRVCLPMGETLELASREIQTSASDKPTRRTGKKLSISFENLTVFQGINDVLGNFYPSELEVYSKTFNSSEHAFQYMKAIFHGDKRMADEILNARNACKAKKLGKKVATRKMWESERIEVMRHIIKMKAECVPFYKRHLLCAKQIIVEAVPGDLFWSCGLCKEEVRSRHPNDWPGKNMMGRLHMDLRDEILRAEQAEDGVSCGRMRPHQSNSFTKEENLISFK